jgi:hypothetical protein
VTRGTPGRTTSDQPSLSKTFNQQDSEERRGVFATDRVAILSRHAPATPHHREAGRHPWRAVAAPAFESPGQVVSQNKQMGRGVPREYP